MATPSDASQPKGPLDSALPEKRITPVIPLHQVPDHILAVVADVSHLIGFPITLYMPWGIATGHTCGYEEYFKHLGDTVRAGSQGAPDGLIKAIDTFAKNNFDRWAEESPEDRSARTFFDGVHLTSALVLKNAKCLLAGAEQPIHHNYLRLRLTDVTAFSWGSASWD